MAVGADVEVGAFVSAIVAAGDGTAALFEINRPPMIKATINNPIIPPAMTTQLNVAGREGGAASIGAWATSRAYNAL